MNKKSVKRSFIQRLLGQSATQKPGVDNCWHYEDGKLTIDLDKTPELRLPGGAIRIEEKNLPIRIIVVLSEDGEYRAYHNRCTHIGHRRLDPVPGTNTVQCCSVNKSTFDTGGEKICGPAPHPIKSYPVDRDQEKLIILIPE